MDCLKDPIIRPIFQTHLYLCLVLGQHLKEANCIWILHLMGPSKQQISVSIQDQLLQLAYITHMDPITYIFLQVYRTNKTNKLSDIPCSNGRFSCPLMS